MHSWFEANFVVFNVFFSAYVHKVILGTLFYSMALQILFNVLCAGIPHGVSWTFDAAYMCEKRKATFNNDTSQTC